MPLITLSRSIPLAEIADCIGACIVSQHAQESISSVATLDQADPSSLCYITGHSFLDQLKLTKAKAVILTEDKVGTCPAIALVVDNPRLAWAQAGSQLFPRQGIAQQGKCISRDSAIADNVHYGKNFQAGDYCSIAENVFLGDDCLVGSGTSIGEGVTIGNGCQIGANVTIYSGTTIGHGCTIHAGVVIGADGFGFERDANKHWHKFQQLAGVVIEDFVEIGANSTIDCGALLPTLLGAGSKIDNLVQIGHGSRIGEHSLLCSGVGIAGSVTLGTSCVVGGQASINSGITIADDCAIRARSVVISSVKEAGQEIGGILPARPGNFWAQSLARLNRLNKVKKRDHIHHDECSRNSKYSSS